MAVLKSKISFLKKRSTKISFVKKRSTSTKFLILGAFLGAFQKKSCAFQFKCFGHTDSKVDMMRETSIELLFLKDLFDFSAKKSQGMYLKNVGSGLELSLKP